MATNGWRKYRWTQAEEKQIVKALEKTFPDNYRAAAEELSKTMTRRTPGAIITRYYNHILKQRKEAENDTN